MGPCVLKRPSVQLPQCARILRLPLRVKNATPGAVKVGWPGGDSRGERAPATSCDDDLRFGGWKRAEYRRTICDVPKAELSNRVLRFANFCSFPSTAPSMGATKKGAPAGCRTYEEVIPLSKRVCKNCGSGHLRRLNRRGWTQLRLLTVLGYYPWECTLCRSRTFCRDNGHRARSEAVLHQTV